MLRILIIGESRARAAELCAGLAMAGHQVAAVLPPGEARADWQIAADFARCLGARLGAGDAAQEMFGFAATAEVFAEHATTTLGRDLDIGGLSYAVLDQRGPQQWPYPAGTTAGQARLYGDHRFATADGRACCCIRSTRNGAASRPAIWRKFRRGSSAAAPAVPACPNCGAWRPARQWSKPRR